MAAKHQAAAILRECLRITADQADRLVSLLAQAANDKDRCVHCGHLFTSGLLGRTENCGACGRDFRGSRKLGRQS